MKSKRCTLQALHAGEKRGCPCAPQGHFNGSSAVYGSGRLKSRRRWDPLIPASVIAEMKTENHLGVS